MVINVVSSKTDQYREGASLVIARTGTPTCPVDMMQKYFSMAGLSHTSDKLFRGIVSTKAGERLRKEGGLSYSRLRELLLAKIEQLGMDPSCLACIVCERVEQQPQLIQECLTDCSNAMGVGGRRRLRMAM